jgi:hypothetical protein
VNRDELRREMEALKREMARAGIGGVPLVAGCRKTGEDGETRPPGIYRTGGSVVVVHDGDGPTAEEMATYFPDAEHMPLLIGGEAQPELL